MITVEGSMSSDSDLETKIAEHQAVVATVGLGYVGLPLLLEFSKQDFPIIGVDINLEKIAALSGGTSYVLDVPDSDVQAANRGRAVWSDQFEALQEADAILICVPTPLGKTRDPDLQHLIAAAEKIRDNLKPDMLICLESTTYPGTTRELLLPILEESGLQAGKEFHLTFSPERIDPGRREPPLADIPKVVGGLTPTCRDLACQLYGQIIHQLEPVSSTEAAEMVKLLENTFRAVNIALVNELAIMCDKLGLDPWEVVEAAATKPYGFMPFSPGPGVGGHCIPLDPHYLSWKLKTLDYNARFIQLAGEINSAMPRFWAEKIQEALNRSRKPVNGSHILLLGVAYKKNTNDLRESPALDLIRILKAKGAFIHFYDPYVQRVEIAKDQILESAPSLRVGLQGSDCIVIVTDHDAIDWPLIDEKEIPVVDCRDVLRRRKKAAQPAGHR